MELAGFPGMLKSRLNISLLSVPSDQRPPPISLNPEVKAKTTEATITTLIIMREYSMPSHFFFTIVHPFR